FTRQEADMGFDFGNLLQQYLGGAMNNANPSQATDDFDRVAQQAPRETLAQGVTQALRSDQTPPFPQMVGQLFNNGSPDQRAGMLNQILATVGPSVLSSVAGGALGNLFGGGAPRQVTPEQASQISPEQAQEIAAKAEQENPGIVDRMGDFYSQHPTLVKALGGAALAIALGHMAQGMQQNRH
ncbi:MAG TPA: hypothetical protein VNT33_05750, partial [Telluria sp.]|nr:hypothetical protein [Telluria sp.]